MLRAGAQFSSIFSGCFAQERDFLQNFEDAPHGSAIFIKIFRMLCTGARFFFQNVEDAPHRSAIFFNVIFEMLRVGARFSMKLSGFSAWERDICPNLQDAPRKDAILNDNADESYTKAILETFPPYPP